ncbi:MULTISPECIES: efflux RND transporter periplasmic adaptor subunit [Psychrobacter]|uniref:efflux RND transporter periplasmic adaptor subunit n=1 Tax=Psychrobacter TaxID=497 RepID=UPI000EC75FB4|nr:MULTISPECIES: HlyD family secretion protein [Psychrobacter]HCN17266.1 hemolysin D [Psychrobacter sp.]
MTASKLLKNSTYLLSAFLLAACQPSPPTEEPVTSTDSAAVDTPIVITNDSVTMTPEHILSIKPSRYQPSVGLQGRIEPIKQTKFTAAHPINVKEILISEGQWVEKETPLLIVRRLESGNTGVHSERTAGNAPLETENSPQENTLANNIDGPKGAKLADKQEKETHSRPEQAPTDDNGNDNKTDIKNSVTDGSEPSKAPSTIDNANVDSSDRTVNSSKGATSRPSHYKLVTVRASFSGRVEELYVKAGQNIEAGTPLLQLSDETKLYFIATLPIQAEPQLSVGQTVNFTAEGVSDKFTGQVSKLTATSQPKKLLVYVDVIENQKNHDKLLPNMKVTGRVNYGQIDVGTIVPKRALHDVDLTELQKPPYKPLRPLTANVWVIGQDQRLKRRAIEVVEYNPTTNQYLIAGISNDSLICLADLPIDSEGKKVIVS